ncbi:MAG: substrate-binding domain-containing protein [Bacteroidales bacterium]
MKQHWMFLLILSILMGGFFSCKNSGARKKNVIIVVIPKFDNTIFDQVKRSSFEAAKDLNITVTWEAPTSVDASKQKEIIENLIAYKVDGILISCNDVEALKEPINAAIKAGIKVATFDSDCPGSDRLFYIGTDNQKAGNVCAKTMLKLYEKANKNPDQVLILSGGMSANNLIQRLDGFRDSIGNVKISDVIYSFEISDYGKELLEYNLNKNSHINGVQMIWGTPVLGGVDSIPSLLKFMNRGGVAVFFDVSKPLLKYIKNNPNCATMKQDFHSMGYDGVKNLYKAIKGKEVEKQILFDVKVIDQSNADKEMRNL